MCSSSVEPTPSRMSTPNRAFQALPTDSGSASPADVQTRKRLPAPVLFSASSLSIAADKVGTPKKMLGLDLFIIANIVPGVGRSEVSTLVEPTDIGKVSAFPTPYAKNSF